MRNVGYNAQMREFVLPYETVRQAADPEAMLLTFLQSTVAIPLAFANLWLALSLYVLVAIMWLIPDRRIERASTLASHRSPV